MMTDYGTIPFTDKEISDAWKGLVAEFTDALARANGELAAVRAELYISELERFNRETDIQKRIGRLSDDLIALGFVQERAKNARMVTTVDGAPG